MLGTSKRRKKRKFFAAKLNILAILRLRPLGMTAFLTDCSSVWLMYVIKKLRAVEMPRKVMKKHQSYRNLPSLAGLCTIEQAMVPGLPVEKCVAR